MLTVPVPQALLCQLALLLRCSSVGVAPAGTAPAKPSLPRSSQGPGRAGTQRWFENLSSNSSDSGTKPYKQGVQGE